MAKRKKRKARSNPGSRKSKWPTQKFMTVAIATLTMRVASRFLSSLLGGMGAWIPPQYVIPTAVFFMTHFKLLNIPELDTIALANIANSFWDSVGLKMVMPAVPKPPATSGAYVMGNARSPAQTREALNQQAARLSATRMSGAKVMGPLTPTAALNISRKTYRGNPQMHNMASVGGNIPYKQGW